MGDVGSHILDIVRAAERKNNLAGVSGLMAYDPQGYFQLIEGPMDAVLKLRRNILDDRRHRVNLQILMQRSERRTPVTLPMAYLATSIPHHALLQSDNTDVVQEFEATLLQMAGKKYPSSFGELAHRPGEAIV